MKKLLSLTGLLLGLGALLLLTGCSPRQGKIQVFDRLGPGQVRDQVTLTIGGVTRTFHLDRQTPVAYGEFSFTSPGVYAWSASSQTDFLYLGLEVPVFGYGQGTIVVTPGKKFEVLMDDSTSPATLALHEIP